MPKKEQSFSNKVRTFLGKDPLPESKGASKDIGYLGNRKKKGKSKEFKPIYMKRSDYK